MQFTLSILLSVLIACNTNPDFRWKAVHAEKNSNAQAVIIPDGTTILTRINTPSGFKRADADSSSFGFYLRNFPLKKNGSKVYLFDGSEKGRQDVHIAVLDIDAGSKDLQQCADAIMRLRAEYLFRKKMVERIHFNFTNGFRADYLKWIDGYRITIKGDNITWVKTAQPSDDYLTFRQYLDIVFSYAGTLSLSKEMKPVPIREMKAGDVFIQGGSPGHAVIIADMAESITDSSKIFLLAQSYMPAQDIHVLKNPEDSLLSPWYRIEGKELLITPEWTFEKNMLMRFAD